MKFLLLLLALPAFAAPPAAPRAATPAPAAVSGFAVTVPANCDTAHGKPCVKLTWNGPTCAATVSPVNLSSTETSGPCIVAILRCSGGSAGCAASTLPALPGSDSSTPITSQGTGNGWTLLTQTTSQTTAASDPYFDNNGVVYGGLYNYVFLLAWTGPGGGIWSSYSGIFPFQMSQAPAPVAAAPAAATGVSASIQ